MNTRLDSRDSGARHPDSSGAPVQETATEARQGSRGMPVLKVLIAGLILAALAWGGAEWWGEASDAPPEQTATPPAGETTPQNSNAAPTANPETPPPAAPQGGGAQNSNP